MRAAVSVAVAALPPPEPERRRGQRRSPYGPALFARCREAGGEPVTFDDLVRAVSGTGARLSDVASWVARARAGGVLEDAGYAAAEDGRPMGPRRFRLARDPFRRGDRRTGGDGRRR